MGQEMVRTVRFMRDQGAEDLYRCEENGNVYVRQRCDDSHVRWLTSEKWRGGYEASCSMKAGLTIRVVDPQRNVLFEENIVQKDGFSGTVATKEGPFSDEAIKKVASEVASRSKLRSYNEWKEILMRSAKLNDFSGYYDNWLYDATYGPVRSLFNFQYLGVPAYCTIQKATHNVSGQTWECVEIRDKSKQTVLEICGYVLEE